MSNKTVQNDIGMRTLNVRRSAADAVRDLASQRGMLQYRMVELLLKGWSMLTPEQQSEAHRRLLPHPKREPVTA